ncbi:hypothetical protein PENTCL1PPCAC_29194, partial [Pristionchus entomophagus]
RVMVGERSADRPPPIPHAFRLFILFLLVRIECDAATASFDLEKALSTPCNPSCFNGACFSETCVCQKGWKGPQCDLCHGRVEIHDLTTPLTDSPVNYPSTANCGWLVDVANSTNLKLTVSNFSTECGWDYLYVYDGEGTDGEQLAALCGQINEPFEINLPSAKSFAFFFSDLAQNHDGFNIAVEHNSCPYNCSGVGRCLPSGECSECQPGHTGRYCEQQFCSEDMNGSDGPCMSTSKCKSGVCDCNQPQHGDLCQESKSSSLWERDVVRSGPQPRGRASHASVLITRGGNKEIWTIFGDRFNNVPNFGEIVVYDTSRKTWNEIAASSSGPDWRYDHSLVYYKSKIYLFGGMIGRTRTSAELWSLDVNTLVWAKENDDNKDLITGPLAVYGHSAHVIDNKMYVFFGFNPVIRFVTRVQIYDFESRQWSAADVTDIDAGRYRHTSVYYEPLHAVLVYGGILQQPTSGDAANNANVTTDKLIRFSIPRDGAGYNWESLTSSGTPMYMHTATIMNGMMITAGGNAYTKNGQPSDCFQGIVLSYDILCNKWTTLNTSPLLRRYGHSMVSDGEDYAWVIGGFNGTMLNDVVRFVPADCAAGSRSLQACVQITEGVQCVFTNGKCTKYSTSESFPADFLSVISGLPAKKSIQRAEPKCQNTADDRSSACEDNSDCLSCASHSGCGWCVGSSQCLSVEQECVAGQDMIRSYTSCQSDLAVREQLRSCSSVSDCFSCKIMKHCNWFGYEGKKSCVSLREQAQVASEMAAREAERLASSKVPVRLTTSLASFPTGLPFGQNFTLCPTPCPEYTNCTTCVENKCMWCGSQKRCVYTDSYLISFPYGQCYQWTTQIGADNSYCEIESGLCSEHKNCSMCQLDPNCGWWDDGGNTGQGACLEGNNGGPRDPAPSAKGSWHFVGCPLCQCNGHSECRKTVESGIELQKCVECGNNTTGAHCETCADGYYGDTRNGGICKPCECVGNADGCDPHSGECYCTTKGVVGKLCDRCDTKYIGNPENGRPCYYELTVDFIFTFKLKNEHPDDHVSEIYLFSVPYKRDTDVQFSISCESATQTAAVSLNLTSNIFDGRSSNPKMKMINHPCDAKGLRRHYLANDPGYAFGTDANTTFFVKVSNFTTPITIQISFAQSPPINWVLFFVIFAACFIILLVVAGLLWMVKLRIEAYRARQNHINELVHMNSRPSRSIKLDLSAPGNNVAPTPIAVEPRANYKVGVVTVAMRLPTGGKPYTPNGTSGLALGSALCLLTPNQEQHLRTSDDCETRPKSNDKLRRFFPFMGRGPAQ